MTFVRRKPNPMRVRKMKAVNAAPIRVADKGDTAAAGYAATIHQADTTYATAETIRRTN